MSFVKLHDYLFYECGVKVAGAHSLQAVQTINTYIPFYRYHTWYFNLDMSLYYSFLFWFAQELLNMEKTRTVSLQLDGKKNKKAKPKKKDLANGGIAKEGGGGESSSGNIKEKCHVM